jgi:hypothetical protein
MPVARWTGSRATPQGWQTAQARLPVGRRARIDTAWLQNGTAWLSMSMAVSANSPPFGPWSVKPWASSTARRSARGW